MAQDEFDTPHAGREQAPQGPDPSTPPEPTGQPTLKIVDRRWWVGDQTPGEPAGEPWRLQRPSYIEELERQLAEKDRLLQDTLVKYRAAAQEFDEVRVRLRRDTVKEIERGRRILLVELLDTVDNLDRAIESATAARTIESLLSGVDMVRQQFLAKLEGFGVRRIPAVGELFDPEKHEAVTLVPTTDPDAGGRVAGVVRQGYLVGDEVLRPATVAVFEAPSVPSA